ncbi:TOBE domain-containing protein [Clostridium sp. 'deep sea']|uniref:TOBE domain-containing protein n=1 Tax=Clostridium sp. 'deep sea' TaxID=2779445 RepID=UPI0018966FAC|nr:TOBE domain-containing protein [Clostridium sp. 'deep sea']QOR36849.1 TOBE domain-containing protein [Clostridium sp. 'deep sea']
MRQEIKRIQSELNITSIYVTHDQKEALAIANKIAVMNSGVIEQLGSSNEIYHHPVNSFVSNFIGESNLVKPQIVKRSKNSCIIKVLDLQVEINTASDEFLCLIRPEEIYPTQHNGIEVKVKWVENMGNIVRYTLSVGNDILIMDRLNKLSNKKYEIGEKLTVFFEKQAVKIVEV